MRLVFLGTPPVAARSLRHLAGTASEIVAVCTHPDRLMGRGLKPHPTAVKETALELGLPVREVQDVRDPAFADWLRSLHADLLVVVAFVILPDAVLATTRLGAVNLHGSLLPRWRGAAPVQRAIEAGEPVTGLSVFRLDSGIDTGGILLSREIAIGPDDTSGDILDRLGELGGPALAEAIDLLGADPIPVGIRQDPALATRAPKLTPEEGRLDWSLPARRLHDKIRAFHPAPGCWTESVDNAGKATRVKVWRTRPVEPVETSRVSNSLNQPSNSPILSVNQGGKAIPPTLGTIVLLQNGGYGVVCGDGILELIEVQAEGKPRRSGSDWFHGQRSQNPSFR